jgi:hypothetical protein
MPPGYCKTIESITWENELEEKSFPFDADFDALKNYAEMVAESIPETFRDYSQPRILQTLNFADPVKWRTATKGISTMLGQELVLPLDEKEYEELMARLKLLMNNRQKIIESAKRRKEIETQNDLREVILLIDINNQIA